MVKSTFINLNDAKKKRITEALLTEFSTHSLTSAQVARIVTNAQIARGAFYKYFEDLPDAYNYLYHIALKKIHTNITTPTPLNASQYVLQVRLFLNETINSEYFNFIKLHVIYNEGILPKKQPQESLSESLWAIATLSHETIKDCLINPDNAESYLKLLEKIITKLLDK